LVRCKCEFDVRPSESIQQNQLKDYDVAEHAGLGENASRHISNLSAHAVFWRSSMARSPIFSVRKSSLHNALISIHVFLMISGCRQLSYVLRVIFDRDLDDVGVATMQHAGHTCATPHHFLMVV
jgi:hypothetical protein